MYKYLMHGHIIPLVFCLTRCSYLVLCFVLELAAGVHSAIMIM